MLMPKKLTCRLASYHLNLATYKILDKLSEFRILIELERDDWFILLYGRRLLCRFYQLRPVCSVVRGKPAGQ